MIESGEYLKNNPKLLLFAACDYDIKNFQLTTRSFPNICKQAIITMIRKTSLIDMDTNEIYNNLNKGKY